MYAFITILICIFLYTFIHSRDVHLKIKALSFEKTLTSRGMMALMVILHHLSYRINTPPTFLFVPLGAMVVGVFFLMSGYGLSLSYQRKGDAYLVGFFRKRVLKLLLPYMVVIAIWNVEEMFLYPDQNLMDAWLLIRTGDTNGILPYSWYVIVALLFYVVFYFTYRLLVSENTRFLVMSLFWAFFCSATFILHWGIYWFFTSHMFLLGFLYHKQEYLIKRCNAYVWMMVMLLLAIVGTIEFHFFSMMLFNTAFSLLFVCGITLFEYRSRFLDFLGKISYELYIVQALPLFALKDSGLPAYLIVVLVVCIDVALAYLLHQSLRQLRNVIA